MAARIFTKLADALAKPENVRRLWVMTMRRGTKLPDFATFPNLEELSIDARGSGLATFPCIANCTKLTSLTFTSSDVTAVPADIGTLAKLHMLRLVGHRKVRGLPDELCQLERLKYLAIDNNGLRRLPQAMGDLRSLDTLIAYNNVLTELPDSLAKLKRLRWLELQCNRMKKPPPVLLKLKVRHLQTDFDGLNRYS